MPTATELNRITEHIIEAAIEVHRALGPGLLESAYEPCLAYELAQRGRRIEQQKPLPVVYKGIRRLVNNFPDENLPQRTQRAQRAT